jgi:hypothetical protein
MKLIRLLALVFTSTVSTTFWKVNSYIGLLGVLGSAVTALKDLIFSDKLMTFVWKIRCLPRLKLFFLGGVSGLIL